jgi:hypothetical protein
MHILELSLLQNSKIFIVQKGINIQKRVKKYENPNDIK